MGKLIITENEKNEIRDLYGVLSEQTSTTTYFLGTNKNAKFTVTGGKEINGVKELTVNLGTIGRVLEKEGLLRNDTMDFSKLTGKLTYNSKDGMVKLTLDRLPGMDEKKYNDILYEFEMLFSDLVTTGEKIDNTNFFHDESLVARLKNVKPIQGSK
jgi:hypothetical protein